MTGSPDQSAFLAAYRDSDQQLRLRHARAGCVLALILMPAGSFLDYFVYPHWLWPIFEARWICNAFIAVVFASLFLPIGRTNLRILGSAWVIAPAVAISWMIYISQGAISPYYAGLNLVIIIGCLLMPYTLGEAIVVCAIVLALYVAACLMHGNAMHNPRILFNNLYFITLTAIIAVTSCYYYDRRRKEEFHLRHQLDARNHQLAEMDRLKSEFFANVSHELRTPLTLILGPVDDLLRNPDNLPQPVAGPLQLVQQNALRLLRLINDLLEIVRLDARSESDKIQLQTVDLNIVIPGIVDAIRHLASAKGIDVELKRRDQPLRVLADIPRLERVLLNLLTNAVKFTASGGRITVSFERNTETALITVADSGVGIPEAELPFIFDRFRQVDGSATRAYRGLGLGLALARELVEEQQGSLSVHSQEGQGTTFDIRMQLSRTSTTTAAAAQAVLENDSLPDTFDAADRTVLEDPSPPQPVSDQITGTGEYCVLVVDDEPDMRRFIVSILEREFRILQTADGSRVLELARRHRPDLIVLDLMLPGVDGLELCGTIRQSADLADVKIILLTARADEQSKLQALQRGADDFLTKPFSSTEIRTRIANLIGTVQLQQSLRRRNDELKQTIDELEKTRAQLVQSEKMNALGSLAAGLLHEVNNPLNFTLTALHVAEQHINGDTDLREILTDIGDGMKRIQHIVTDLRAFAYPDKTHKRTQIDIQDVVEAALRFTSQSRDDICVQVQLAPQRQVIGSHNHLVQVMINLLNNAVASMQKVEREHEPQVKITSVVSGDRLQVSVIDNGIGIDEQTRSHIFDPFFTTGDVGEGMGVGLSVCHTILKEHEGTISVDSEPGHGARFTFDLPLAEKKEELI